MIENKLKKWITAMIVLIVLDISTTYISIVTKIGYESNPLVVNLFNSIGLELGLILLLVGQILLFVFGYKYIIKNKIFMKTYLVGIIIVVLIRSVVVTNNILVLTGVR